MSGSPRREISLREAATTLGEGITVAHVMARLRRGTLLGRCGTDGLWRVAEDSVQRALQDTPACDGCGAPATELVIVKYRHHDRVEFPVCAAHGAAAVQTYRRRGAVLEVVTFPYHSEAWLRSDPA